MKYWALYREGNPEAIEILIREVEPVEKDFKFASGYMTKYEIKEVNVLPVSDESHTYAFLKHGQWSK